MVCAQLGDLSGPHAVHPASNAGLVAATRRLAAAPAKPDGSMRAVHIFDQFSVDSIGPILRGVGRRPGTRSSSTYQFLRFQHAGLS